MNKWDKKYREKISKGYENIKSVGSNVTPPTNWIQGMSVAQRKKQGITTVMPSKMDKDGHEENSIHYDVGQVDVEVNHSHQNKLRILKMTMENWSHDGRLRIEKFLYEADLHKVKDLMESGREILTKDEMLDLNVLFKTYGGKRKVNE